MENKDFDILLELEKEEMISTLEEKQETKEIQNTYIYQTIVAKPEEKPKVKAEFSFKKGSIFALKYTFTSLLIFAVLIVGTNYKAYLNIAKGMLMEETIQKESKGILNSVEASNIKEKVVTKNVKDDEEKKEEEKTISTSIKKYKKELDEKNISLNIEITPYENRIIIPKIGKNIPLVDVKNRKVDSEHELEDIFMKELENGVVRYPGSAIPGEKGNTFVFGHSSNFPWINGDYNEVFSNLNFLEKGDEIIIYYGQKKFRYIINEKRVISAGDVSILKRDNSKKELSVMTCWPIGTAAQRLVVIGELVEEN
ncbi:sortase [Candidatus Gracilibacteria bacterium]|nr:sortase [Candidatus Gracilibacteria bacterium]